MTSRGHAKKSATFFCKKTPFRGLHDDVPRAAGSTGSHTRHVPRKQEIKLNHRNVRPEHRSPADSHPRVALTGRKKSGSTAPELTHSLLPCILLGSENKPSTSPPRGTPNQSARTAMRSRERPALSRSLGIKRQGRSVVRHAPAAACKTNKQKHTRSVE